MRSLDIRRERFALARAFTISRGSKTEAEVIVCTIRDGARAGRGECVPYARYGETVASVRSAIEEIGDEIASGMDRQKLLRAMPAGAARNACFMRCRRAPRATRSIARFGTSKRSFPDGRRTGSPASGRCAR